MKKGSVIIDVAVDQGSIETIDRVTTHADPSMRSMVLFTMLCRYARAVARTSTFALANATSYALELANNGCEKLL